MSAPIVKLYGESAEGVPRTAVPMGRMGDDEDVAGVMLYLASRAGAYCNAAIIVTDGGRLGTFPSAY
jgi:NAD(P)-dependent dehydrogenase (short-subunit alcohol dehydrogenase family)